MRSWSFPCPRNGVNYRSGSAPISAYIRRARPAIVEAAPLRPLRNGAAAMQPGQCDIGAGDAPANPFRRAEDIELNQYASPRADGAIVSLTMPSARAVVPITLLHYASDGNFVNGPTTVVSPGSWLTLVQS